MRTFGFPTSWKVSSESYRAYRGAENGVGPETGGSRPGKAPRAGTGGVEPVIGGDGNGAGDSDGPGTGLGAEPGADGIGRGPSASIFVGIGPPEDATGTGASASVGSIAKAKPSAIAAVALINREL
jgi:hypothetical protein